MNLRWFQELAIDNIDDNFSKGHTKQILCKGTGSGKTYTGSVYAKRRADAKGTVLILVDRIELLMQWHRQLAQLGVNASVLTAEKKTFYLSGVNVAMVETIWSRYKKKWPDIFDCFDLIIHDERHRGNFNKIDDVTQDIQTIGVTATPISSNAAEPLNKRYTQIVCPVTVPQLISEGFLVPCKTFSIDHDFKKLKKQGYNFSEDSQMNHFSKSKLYDGAIDNYRLHSEGRKFLCFCVNRAHAKETANRFNEAGIKVRYVDGETRAEERAAIFRALNTGDIMGVINVGVATTGFDEPSIECIIYNRCVGSMSLNDQILGRGARICDSIEKDNFHVIDMGANWERHGIYGIDRHWDEVFREAVEGKRQGEVEEKKQKLKNCDNCGGIIEAGSAMCSYCGNIFDKKEIKKALDKYKTTREINDEREADNLIKLMTLPREMLRRTHWDFHDFKKYGQVMGHDGRWAFIKTRGGTGLNPLLKNKKR